ncbi:MAG: DUF45 domain-containing protein, partial [Proteobacteria bacterium]|nr:DUF45 domain-containing protein [Pseudomonadota bacterium]
MSQEYNLHGIQVIIKRKKVRNINLKVNQLGQVILSCPNKIGEKIIQDFLESKHEWIKNSIEKLSAGNKFYNKRYEEGEVHFLFGEPLILKIHPESKSKSKIEKEDCNLIMRIKSGKSIKTKEKHLQEWYKNILLMESQKYFTKWEKILEVSKHELIVKKMRGKWGYCD